jgi:apyrase
MDLTFCFTLLTHGFGMGPSATLTLVKQISYQGNLIEAAWPLGAAINSIG